MTATQNLSNLFQKHKEDFKYCEKIIKNHSKTFYAAFSLLPKHEAMSVYAVYAFCRKADDLVDEESNVHGLEQLKTELSLFENNEEIDHPIWRALRVVFTAYPMEILPFYDMIQGQAFDLNFVQPETLEELENYSYYVASSVGLMLLPMLTKTPKKLRNDAIALGIAMQLTNILRDVGEDLKNDRIYLPKEKMKEFGYTEEMLKDREINSQFIKMWESQANRAESYYEQSLNILPHLKTEAKKPLYLSIVFYKEILEVVRENDYQCFKQRAVVDKKRKMELLTLVDEKLN